MEVTKGVEKGRKRSVGEKEEDDDEEVSRSEITAVFVLEGGRSQRGP